MSPDIQEQLPICENPKLEVGIHAGLENGNAAQAVKLRCMRVEVEGAGDEDIVLAFGVDKFRLKLRNKTKRGGAVVLTAGTDPSCA